MHENFEEGMRAKHAIEEIVVGMHMIVILLVVAGIVKLIKEREPRLFIGAMVLWSTSLFNSIDVLFHQIKNQRQFFL